MLNIQKTVNGDEMLLKLSGRLDTNTSSDLDREVKSDLSSINKLNIDMNELDYISSAGLRVLLSLQKIMNKQGEMTLCGVNRTVMEIFEVTGFSDILNFV